MHRDLPKSFLFLSFAHFSQQVVHLFLLSSPYQLLYYFLSIIYFPTLWHVCVYTYMQRRNSITYNFMYLGVLLDACLCTIYVPSVVKAKRGCQIPCYQLQLGGPCECWDLWNLSSLEEQTVFLSTESSLQLTEKFIVKFTIFLFWASEFLLFQSVLK